MIRAAYQPRLTHWLALFLLVLLPFRGLADDQSRTTAFDKRRPENIADLRTIEQAAVDVAKQARACTVGLQIGRGQGSGVIVSEDGYVLTAGHVIGRPGRDARVRLPDGSFASGKTLGIHTEADIGLVKIDGDRKWPFVPIVPAEHGPRAGDWCLTMGHPNGFQSERSAPVRLGRVIDVRADVLRTDCPVTGGDSGGPLLDLQARVIGIHSRIGARITQNLHGPALAGMEVWDKLAAGEIHPTRPISHFVARLDVDQDGNVTRAELPEGTLRAVYDRFAERYQLDPEQGYSIEDLAKKIGWQTSRMPFLGPTDGGREQFGESLSRRLFVRGSDVLEAFADVVAEVRKSTVRVKCEGEQVALGVIVAADGWIVTKASQLHGEIRCEPMDRPEFVARRVDVDRENDLALLRIDAQDLNSIDLSKSADLVPGSWLVTPGMKSEVASVGVVSVGPRKIANSPAVLGVEIANTAAAKVSRVLPNSGAAAAGILDGDVITQIMERQVKNLGELRSSLSEYRAGDVVTASITRGEKALKLDVTLGAQGDVFFQFGRPRPMEPLSRRRDGFSTAIQHDSVLHPTQCGGPVVDISGKMAGINIARSDRIACLAVPVAAIKPLIEKHVTKTVSTVGDDKQ